MPAKSSGIFRRSSLAAWLGLAVTLAAFFGVTLRYAVNIPTLDDYDCGLEFLLKMTHQPTAWSKVLLLLSSQHNEYKTVLQSGIFWLQYALFGKLNFRLSMVIGDLFPLVIGFLLWKFFSPRNTAFPVKLALFVPAAMLFFQLNYAEALNAPMTALQHLPAVAFTFLAIYFLVNDTKPAFAWAIVALLVGLTCSTNVFLTVPIGIAILALRKQFVRLAVWLFVFIVALVVYRFHYQVPPPRVVPGHIAFLKGLLLLKPLYALAVLGAAAWPLRFTGACALGLALVGFNLFLLRRGYFRRNPVIGWCEVFLLLTAMGIAHVRLDFGLELSTSSRYRMYSDLLLAFAWLAIAEEFLVNADGTLRIPLRRNPVFAAVLVLALLNVAVCDRAGNRFFKARYRYWTQGVAAYENPEFPGSTVGSLLPVIGETAERDEAAVYCRQMFNEAIAAGIYAPPQYSRPAYPLIPQLP